MTDKVTTNFKAVDLQGEEEEFAPELEVTYAEVEWAGRKPWPYAGSTAKAPKLRMLE